MSDVLVVSVSDPWNCSTSGEKNSNVGEETSDQNRGVLISSVLICSDHLEDQPSNTRDSAARVYTTEMLKYRGASQSEFEWGPL